VPNRIELKTLCRERLKEAKVLYEYKLYDGSFYLAGYVIELAFKARICKILGTDYPESGEISRSYKTHELDNLLKLSGLYTSFDHDIPQNAALKVSWSVVKSWSEAYRYSPKGTNSQQDVRDLIEAIEHPDHGILTWLKKKW
jgi:HEPN domain-containing protein